MSTLHHRLCPVALLVAAGVTLADTPAVLWNFNEIPDAPEATLSPPPAFGQGSASLLGGVTASFATGVPGAASGRAWNTTRFPTQSTAPGTAGVRFSAPTLGLTHPRLGFQHRFSARSSGRALVRVSVNGVDFTDLHTYESPGPDLWTNVVVDLTTIPFAADNDAFAFEVVSVFGADTDRYLATGPSSTYAPSGTWRWDDVRVSGDPLPDAAVEPRVLVPPSGRIVTTGDGLRLGVGASGAPPLRYQWSLNDVELPGETRPVLERASATTADGGRYQVLVWNDSGSAASDPAEVVILPPPPPYHVTNCAALHEAVVGPEFSRPAVEGIVALEGIVTTHTSLHASGSLLFYLQDSTGGIAALWKGASPESLPPAGTRVRVVGQIAQANGVLQIVADTRNPLEGVTLLEADLPLPDPVDLDVALMSDPVRMELLEGRRVRISGVTLDTRTPLFPDRGANVTLTTSAPEAKVILRVDGDSRVARVDLAGQPKPVGPFTVTGIWTQNDATRPFTEGYQILPTRWLDLVPDGRPPEGVWTAILEHPIRPGDALTNAFPEQVLLPGEGLRILAEFSDDQGPIQPGPGTALPERAWVEWNEGSVSEEGIHHRTATIRFVASDSDAGILHRWVLSAGGTAATRRMTWTVYVPTEGEQHIRLSEYLANPTARPQAPGFNPLQRDDWPPASDAAVASKLTSWDEFVEVVNLGANPANLGGWTVSDATRTRAWLDPEDPASLLPPRTALVVYGGPVGHHEPGIPSPALAAIPGPDAVPGTDGLGLNNTGDTILLRNADGRLVERIVFGSRGVSGEGSMVRWPLPNGPWTPHAEMESGRPASPGTPPTGAGWTSGDGPTDLKLTCLVERDQIHLLWMPSPGATYSVRELFPGAQGSRILTANLNLGEYWVPVGTERLRLFQITSP